MQHVYNIKMCIGHSPPCPLLDFEFVFVCYQPSKFALHIGPLISTQCVSEHRRIQYMCSAFQRGEGAYKRHSVEHYLDLIHLLHCIYKKKCCPNVLKVLCIKSLCLKKSITVPHSGLALEPYSTKDAKYKYYNFNSVNVSVVGS